MSLPLTPALEVIPGSRSASHSPEAALAPGSGSDPYHGHQESPNPDTRTCKLPWYENTARDHHWDYRSYHRIAVIQATQHSWEPGLMRPQAILLNDTRIWSWEDKDWDNQNWNLKTEIIITGNMPEPENDNHLREGKFPRVENNNSIWLHFHLST